MTADYNDGLWHGWNGGECPVHPRSKVEWVAIEGRNIAVARALNWAIKATVPIIAFRVVEEYREPREFWVAKTAPNGMRTATDKPPFYSPDQWIHVREVMEGQA